MSNDLLPDSTAWQEQYRQLMSGLFENGQDGLLENSSDGLFFSAFSSDVQQAWGRLVQHWATAPEQLQAIRDDWQHALDTFHQATTTLLPIHTASPLDAMQAVPHIKQLHSALKSCLNRCIDEAPDARAQDRRLLKFCTRQLINAVSADNWPITNKEVMRAATDSNGMSIVQGMQNFHNQLLNNGDIFEPKTANKNDFVLGESLALTPGEVVYQNKLFQLIQYYPFSQQVNKTPILIVPPWINKYYVLDLNPADSLLQWLVKQGHSVFVISWVNPDASHRDIDLDNYLLQGSIEALNQVRQITGEQRADLLGFCIGGLLAALSAAWLQAQKMDHINSLTLLNTLLDYSDAGELSAFLSENMLDAAKQTAEQTGIFSGRYLRRTFTLLREDKMFWPYVINNYFLGREPEPNPLLFWNQDATNLPYPMFRRYINDMYIGNKLFRDEAYTIAGQSIGINNINAPVYAVASKRDHIVPWQSAFNSVAGISDVTFTLSNAGHITGIINPPAKNRYGYWHATDTPKQHSGHAENWLATAEKAAGSWWQHWQNWLSNASGEKVQARFPGQNGLPVIESAPGSYVKKAIPALKSPE